MAYKQKIKKRKEYVILATPKYENSGYKPFVISPNWNKIKWDKKRAEEELKFAGRKEFQGTGLRLKETHKLKVVQPDK